VPIYARITAVINSAIADPTTAIQNAVIAYANNEVAGITGFTVGHSVSPFEMSAAVVDQVAGIYVKKAELKYTSTFTASISTTTMTVSAVATGAIYVGMLVAGAATGTTVTAFLSGTGGTGTYTVSVSQTLGSTSLQADWQTTELPMLINQKAVIIAGNITVIPL
jgi:hypothetical protein